jgi:hypothetical protein
MAEKSTRTRNARNDGDYLNTGLCLFWDALMIKIRRKLICTACMIV